MKRLMIGVLVGVTLLGTVALGAERVGRAGTGAGQATLDDRATRVRRDLGRFCSSFDFFFKHAFSDGEMRPVRCSRRTSEATVAVAYAFTSRSLRDDWLNEWGTLASQRGVPVIKGRRWVVEVLRPRWEEEIRAELAD